MKHDTSYKRHKDIVHKKRKIDIVKNTWHDPKDLLESNVFKGKLVKGKVHCSCAMCAAKTNKKSIYQNGWKHSDKKKQMKGAG